MDSIIILIEISAHSIRVSSTRRCENIVGFGRRCFFKKVKKGRVMSSQKQLEVEVCSIDNEIQRICNFAKLIKKYFPEKGFSQALYNTKYINALATPNC